MGDKTTNFGWDIGYKGKNPWWETWDTLWDSVDTELFSFASFDETIAPTADDLVIMVGGKKVTIGNLFRNIPDGNYTAPGLTFGSNQSLGFHKSAANTIGIGPDILGIFTDYPAVLSLSKNNDPLTDKAAYGLHSMMVGDPSATSSRELVGVYGEAETASGNNQTINCAYIGGLFESIHSGTGTIQGISGISSSIGNFSTGIVTYGRVNDVRMDMINTGTITNLYGVVLRDLVNVGTITNTYGIYIGDLTAGIQTNQAYGIYQIDTGVRNYFGGSMEFGTFTAKGAEVFDGYITIKDAGGTLRKVMTCI